MGSKESRRTNKYSFAAHLVACGIPAIYAISHVLFFQVPDSAFKLANPVFPFLENRVVSIITLVIIFVCSLPLSRMWIKVASSKARGSIAAAVVIAVALSVVPSLGAALTLSGKVSAVYRNPSSGQEYTQERQESRFSVWIHEDETRVKLTGVKNEKQFGYLAVRKEDFVYTSNLYRALAGRRAKEDAHFIDAIIDNVTFPAISDYDKMAVIPIWLGMAMRKSFWGQPQAGLSKQMPIPWFFTRDNLKGYGYRWEPSFNEDSQFPSEVIIRRDASQDLSEKDELERPMFDTPSNSSRRNHALSGLQIRRGVADNAEVGRYRVLEWAEIDGLIIPRKAELLIRSGSGERYRHPWISYLFEVDPAQRSEIGPLEELAGPIRLFDYRYREKSGHRFIPYGIRSFASIASVHDIRMKPAVASGVQIKPISTSVWSFKRITTYVVLFLAVATAAFFALTWRNKHKK